MLKPLKTIAICHVKAYFVVFLHQMAGKSTKIAHPRGNRRSVMVVTREYHDPAHEPPPLFCLMLAYRKGGCICRILWYLPHSLGKIADTIVLYKHVHVHVVIV